LLYFAGPGLSKLIGGLGLSALLDQVYLDNPNVIELLILIFFGLLSI